MWYNTGKQNADAHQANGLTSACIFPFLKKGAMPSATDCPPVHNCTLKNFVSNRREQPVWAARRSSSTIPVFRNTKSSTLPVASFLTSSPTTKAKKASRSSRIGWLSVKRNRRKERQGKVSNRAGCRQIGGTFSHAEGTSTHAFRGVKKWLIARLLGHVFDSGMQLPADVQKRLSKCVNSQILSAVHPVSLLIECM